jgi:threonine/homoserine/homoserine lactone efflux protein
VFTLFAAFVSHPEYGPGEKLFWMVAFFGVVYILYLARKAFPHTESDGGTEQEAKA